MLSILTTINLVTAVLLIGAVLLQNRGSSLSGAFGGEGESFYTRRGADKFLFMATIILAIVFAGSVLAQSIIS